MLNITLPLPLPNGQSVRIFEQPERPDMAASYWIVHPQVRRSGGALEFASKEELFQLIETLSKLTKLIPLA